MLSNRKINKILGYMQVLRPLLAAIIEALLKAEPVACVDGDIHHVAGTENILPF